MRRFRLYPFFSVANGIGNFYGKNDSDLIRMLHKRNAEILEQGKLNGLSNESIIKMMSADSQMEAINEELRRRFNASQKADKFTPRF